MLYIGFPIMSLIYVIIFLILYFSKKRINLFENKIVSILMVVNTIGLLLELGCYSVFLIFHNETTYTGMLILKSYIFYMYIFDWVLTGYICALTNKNFERMSSDFKKIFYKTLLYFSPIIILGLVLCFFTKLDYYAIYPKYYTFGLSVDGIIYASVIIIPVWIFRCFRILLAKHSKEVAVKINAILLGIIFVGVSGALMQLIDRSMLIITSAHTLMISLIYFTIENPDLKIIRELSEAKKTAEKYINEKEIFSFNMSQKIKDPIKDIEVLCEDLSSSNDIEELKEGINSIRISSSKIKYLVSDTLSKVSPDKIDIRENEYNTSLLFKEVNYYIKNKASKYNVSFVESKFNKEVIAKGDNLKIKQIICSFATNLLKEIKSMILTLNTNVVENENDYLVSFKFIIPKINITLEELNKNEEIGKYEELDFNNISLSKLKKLINLLDGYIEIKNVDEELMEITINFEQAKSVIKDNKSLSLIDEYEKEINKPKIMLVDDDNDTKNISRYINNHKYDLTIATSGQEALELVRNNNKYDLILLDDDLDKLDTITVFYKFNAIDGFNTPVIYVGDVSNKEKEEDLLNIGFSAVLLKPIKQKEIDEIIDKYVK